MKRVMVRYRVRPDQAAANEGSIKAVFQQLEERQPSGLRYASFKLDDGVSFVHIVSHETADGSHALQDLPAFQAFTAAIQARCVEPPVATPLHEIGSYRVSGD
jgi:hypothetical protein